MKFGHALKFNSVPEWKDAYIRYSLLKKLIFEEERYANGPGEEGARRSLGEQNCLLWLCLTRKRAVERTATLPPDVALVFSQGRESCATALTCSARLCFFW